jgi:hypothetical protein
MSVHRFSSHSDYNCGRTFKLELFPVTTFNILTGVAATFNRSLYIVRSLMIHFLKKFFVAIF